MKATDSGDASSSCQLALTARTGGIQGKARVLGADFCLRGAALLALGGAAEKRASGVIARRALGHLLTRSPHARRMEVAS